MVRLCFLSIFIAIALACLNGTAIATSLGTIKAAPKGAAIEDPRCGFKKQVRAGFEFNKDFVPIPTEEIDLDVFENRFFRFAKINSGQNQKFIQVSGKKKPNQLYFTVENVILKLLNDKIFENKDLATAVTNLFKDILLKNIESTLDPKFKKKELARYSDYKTVRLVFDENSPQLVTKLNKIYLKSAIEFQRALNKKQFYDLFAREDYRGLVLDPTSWNLAGIGTTLEEADLASRMARSEFKPFHPTSAVLFANAKKDLGKKLDTVFQLQQRLEKNLSVIAPQMLTSEKCGGGACNFVSIDALEVLRKVKAKNLPEYYAYLRKRFQSRFEVTLPDEVLTDIKEYFHAVDLFSPGLLIEKRDSIDMSKAVNGLLGIDFAGQGAKNHYYTQLAIHLHQADMDLSPVLQRTRASERKSTAELLRRKNLMQELITAISNGNVRYLTSGDDGMAFPTDGFTDAQKVLYLQRLAKKESGDLSHYRFTFMPQEYKAEKKEIPVHARSHWAVRGENLEKALRIELEGKIPFPILKRIIMAVGIQPISPASDKIADIDLFVGVEALKTHLAIVQTAFANVVQQPELQGLRLSRLILVHSSRDP